ncbi:MAG: hypothetical protein ACERKD_12055 [Prolixibacteraceae bacterium]
MMNDWMQYPKYKPAEDGLFLVSVKRPEGVKDFYFFKSIAKYDFDQDRWYRYESFNENPVGEIIQFDVVGWMELPGVFLG